MTNKIVFGPVTSLSTWNWFKDIPEYLGLDVFQREPPADADTIVWIKTANPVKGKRNIYCPIDRYDSEEEIIKHKKIFDKVDTVIVQSDIMKACYSHHVEKVVHIEHHNKFGLTTMPEYKEKGYCLWIGHIHYLPYLITYRKGIFNPPMEIKVLTSWDNPLHVSASRLRRTPMIEGMRVYDWSPELQAKMMAECKCALDVKGKHQELKPATKGQQFIASGIPFAVNRSAYTWAYLSQQGHGRGFSPCEPTQFDRWTSREYHKECQTLGSALKKELSLEVISQQWLDVICK